MRNQNDATVTLIEVVGIHSIFRSDLDRSGLLFVPPYLFFFAIPLSCFDLLCHFLRDRATVQFCVPKSSFQALLVTGNLISNFLLEQVSLRRFLENHRGTQVFCPHLKIPKETRELVG